MPPELRGAGERGARTVSPAAQPSLGHIPQPAALPPQPLLANPQAPPTLLPSPRPDQSHHIDPHVEQDEAAQNQKNRVS